MSTPLTVNGTVFQYPQLGDNGWGPDATNWATAVTQGMLQQAGGLFTLTSEVDFGANYGVKSLYYKSRTANIASAGQIRLAQGDTIQWRNNANSGDLALTVSSDNLTFNGQAVVAGDIFNANINVAADIQFSKMETLTASRALTTNSSGKAAVSAVTSTELGYVSGVTSALQTQIAALLPKAGGTMTGTLVLNGNPSSSNDAANKAYVDAIAMGLVVHTAVRVATTANGTLASAFENGDTIDGVVLATNDRILIKNQSAPAENGIYTVNASGAPTRATDADTWAELVSAFVFVTAGTANANSSWVCTVAAGGTLNTTAVTFAQFSQSATFTASGTGITLTGSQFALQIDGTTLSQSGSGVKVASGGITNTEVNASAAIATSKLAATTADRAAITNGSGFFAAATTTATQVGYLADVTGLIQNQLDGKIAKSLLTTTNDMIYATGASTPARLAAGIDGYSLRSNSGVPTWTNRNISTTYFSTTTTYNVQSTYTALTLVAVTDSVGAPCVRSGDAFTFPITGRYEIWVFFGSFYYATTERGIYVRLRNTTDNTTLNNAIAGGTVKTALGEAFFMRGNVTDISKSYSIQIKANGTGVSAAGVTTDGETTPAYVIVINRIPQ